MGSVVLAAHRFWYRAGGSSAEVVLKLVLLLKTPMRVGQLSASDAVDALRLPSYSSRHPTGHMFREIYLIWTIPFRRGFGRS